MMECNEAQALVSAALDKEPLDAASLQVAKEHCRTCESCNAFVRTLAAVQRQPRPQPPADLADRIIARVRAEAAAQRAAAAAAPASATPTEPAAGRRLDPRAIWRDPKKRAAAAAWASAAAVVLVVAGIATYSGVRQILIPPLASESPRDVVVLDAAAPESSQPYNGAGATAQQSDGSATSTAMVAPVGYISVDGTVYRYAGLVQGVDSAALRRIGSANTALDAPTDPPASIDVLASPDLTRVFVSREQSETVYAFDRVTRLYNNTVYVLRSGDIARFGEWPSLPSGIPQPQTPEGSPTFTPDGQDASGVTVYRRTGSSTDSGIAIGPGSPASDPAAGNPGWTWWEPLQTP